MLTLLRTLHLPHRLPQRWSVALAMAATLLAAPVAHAALTTNGNGTVTDSTTGLVWDQCVRGRSTTTTTACDTGTAITYTWANALAEVSARNTANHLGYSDWRLPNKNELESIVKLDAQAPAIDTTVFPNTPITGDFWGEGGHWTSTTYAPFPALAWVVDFYDGGTNAYDKTGDNFVRLVRSGQSFASFDSLLPVVNGSCGSAHATTPLITSAPSTNLCGLGSTAGSVATGTSAYTWSCAGSNSGTTASCSASRGYTVTPSAGAGAGNGSISPNTPQVVVHNATPAFTVTPNGGYTANASGCGGALSGTTYTTAAVTADCAVSASFTGNDSTPDAFSFTAANGVALSTVQTSNSITVAGINTAANISITGGEYQINGGAFTTAAGTVNNGDTVTVRHTSSGTYSTATTTRLTIGGVSAGYGTTTVAAPAVNGSCGSAHATTPLVTSAPSANLCTAGTASSVAAGTSAFSWSCTGANGGNTASCSANRGYTVTASVGAGAGNGSISPNTPQVVAYNATPAFTLAPNSGYTANASGCAGALSGNTYTTGAVTADCTVSASFVANVNKTYTAPAPSGVGSITTQLSGGGATCGLQSTSYQPVSSVGVAPPAGLNFVYGVVNFTTSNTCDGGGNVTISLAFPAPLPANARFYKFGPATPGAPSSWYEHPATFAGNTITYTVTDNGQGDSNPALGQITDPGGPAIPAVPGAPAAGAGNVDGVPTLGEWAMLLLVALMGVFAMGRVGRMGRVGSVAPRA